MASKTISQWCDSHHLSRSCFYNLQKAGKAPRIMRIGTAVRITDDADREWQSARERDSAALVLESAGDENG